MGIFSPKFRFQSKHLLLAKTSSLFFQCLLMSSSFVWCGKGNFKGIVINVLYRNTRINGQQTPLCCFLSTFAFSVSKTETFSK